MAVVIRLSRHGRKKKPFYRIVAANKENARDGRYLEVLGTFDPCQNKGEGELHLKLDRIDHWKSCGAQPSPQAAQLIKKAAKQTA